MANPSYGKCYPFENADQQAREAEWRHYGGAFGDGIVGPPGAGTSSAFSITASTSTRTVTLNLADFRLRGCMFEPTQTSLDLNIPPIAAGDTRIDRLLARFDPVAKNVTFYIKAGVAATPPATPAFPSVSRVPGGVWEEPLWVMQGGNVAANALEYSDQRVWLGDIMHGNLPPGLNTELNLGRPDGSRFYHLPSGEEWVQTYPGGVATWRNIDNPDWSNLNIGTGMVAGTSRPQYRVRRGRLEMRGNGRRVSTANGGVWAPAAGGANLEQVVGTLPESLAPGVQHVWAGGVEGGMNGYARMYVRESGEIVVTIIAGERVSGVYYDCVSYTPGA